MASVQYRGYHIELISHRLKSGSWSPWAGLALEQGGHITFSSISARRKTGFKTKKEADACALALAKAWIDRRLGNS